MWLNKYSFIPKTNNLRYVWLGLEPDHWQPDGWTFPDVVTESLRAKTTLKIESHHSDNFNVIIWQFVADY
jgi:hypothetical protein